MSDFSHTKIRFPPPPPTCNTLTAAQRTHLLKSTKKLGKVLGATPQVLDETHPLGGKPPPHCYRSGFGHSSLIGSEPTTGPLIVQLHFGTLRAHTATTRHYRRGSLDSLVSTCSSFESTSSGSPILSGPASPAGGYSDGHTDSWRLLHAKKRLPLLKLAGHDSTKADSILLEPITPTSASPPASPLEDVRYSLAPPTRDRRSSLYAESPAFSIPSESTMRREKMDRVKRRLGDGVPVDLVFPSPTDPTFPYPSTSPASPTPQTETQPRWTMQHADANSRSDRQNLGPIMESLDEHRTTSSLSHYHGCDASRCGLPEEVDVDLDQMFRQLVEHLGFRRRLWGRPSTSVSEFEMATV